MNRSHPGWVIQFEDKSWLGCAHGFFESNDAFYAKIFDSKEYAESVLKEYMEEENVTKPANIIPAWEPLCEKLKLEVASLMQTNKIDPVDLMLMEDNISGILSKIKEWQK